MICAKAQALVVKIREARDKKKVNYYRRRLREHMKSCEFCKSK